MPISREGTQYTTSSVDELCNLFSKLFAKPPWYVDIFMDLGMGFILGGMFGTVFDYLKGMYDSPEGQRLSGGSEAVSKNGTFRFGPIVAAHFGVYAVFRNLLEDNICNSVFAAATTFGSIQLIRSREICSAARSAFYGVLLLGFLEFMEGDGKAKVERALKAKGKMKKSATGKKKKSLSISWEKGKGWDLNYD